MEKSLNTWLPSFFLQNQSKSGKIQQKIKDQIQHAMVGKKKNKQTTEKLEQRIHHAKVGKIKVPFAEEKSLLTYRGFGGTPKDRVTSGSGWLSLGTATAIQQQNPAGLFLCAPGRLPGNLLLVNLFKQDSRNRDVMHLEEFCIIFNFITAWWTNSRFQMMWALKAVHGFISKFRTQSTVLKSAVTSLHRKAIDVKCYFL